jgi:hypothetical protein
MRTTIGAIAALAIGSAVPALAQQAAPTPRSIVDASGGVTSTSEATSAAINLDYGVTIWRHVVAFGGVGRLMNVEPSLAQQAVAATVSNLAAKEVDVTGQPEGPAWYADGGVRFMIPAGARVMPFVFTALGVGHTMPSGRFTYQGTLGVAGGTTMAGEDATTDVQSADDFTSPAGEWGTVARLGGGVLIPIHKTFAATVGYDFTRIGVSTPFNVRSVTFGIGYHF